MTCFSRLEIDEPARGTRCSGEFPCCRIFLCSHIVLLQAMGEQWPKQIPGDLVITLKQREHKTFKRQARAGPAASTTHAEEHTPA